MKENVGPTLVDISARLDQVIRLLAMAAIADKKQRDQISILSRAGLDRHEIAGILGTTPGTVSVELSALKKITRGKGKRG